ncbi:hypothetical protein [Bittarella sp. HCP28S3_D9]|uniref:hypothetical protein n=1 Tax=Bittarella sp. HCP28S3_D9 TaxID=3440253 RepID=UPI003F8A5058
MYFGGFYQKNRFFQKKKADGLPSAFLHLPRRTAQTDREEAAAAAAGTATAVFSKQKKGE